MHLNRKPLHAVLIALGLCLGATVSAADGITPTEVTVGQWRRFAATAS